MTTPLPGHGLLDKIDPLTTKATAPSQKRRQLLDSVDNDEVLARDVIRLFAHQAPAQLAALREAIERADFVAIGQVAHTLRGSATNFGTDPVLDSLWEIEALAAGGDLRRCAAMIDRIDAQTLTLIEVLRATEESLPCAS